MKERVIQLYRSFYFYIQTILDILERKIRNKERGV